MSQSKWSVPIFLAVLLLTFVSSYFFMVGRGENQAAELTAPAITLAKKEPIPSADEDTPPKPDVEAGDQLDTQNKLTTQRDGLLLKRLTLPEEKNADGTPRKNDHVIQSLALDPIGKRVVAASRQTTHCLDISTGQVLQTFANDSPPHNTVPQFIAVAPDARFVMACSADGKEMTLREAATARLIGTYRLADNPKFYHFQFESRLPALTPSGDFLLLGAGTVTPNALHAVSTRTGTGKLVDVPRVDISKKDYKYLLPVPQGSTFIVHGGLHIDKANPSNLFAVDFSTGKETPLTCLHDRPTLVDNRPLVLSPDGTLLLVKGLGTLEVCDWRNNRLLFEYKVHTAARYSDACFTPDGKRIAGVWHENNNRVIYFNADPKTGKSIPRDSRMFDEVLLFDLDRQEQIASFKPYAYGLGIGVRAMAVSHDGQSLALWSGVNINLVDFQAAFGVPALPPSRRLQGPEQLPLKEATANPEPARKRK